MLAIEPIKIGDTVSVTTKAGGLPVQVDIFEQVALNKETSTPMHYLGNIVGSTRWLAVHVVWEGDRRTLVELSRHQSPRASIPALA